MGLILGLNLLEIIKFGICRPISKGLFGQSVRKVASITRSLSTRWELYRKGLDNPENPLAPVQSV